MSDYHIPKKPSDEILKYIKTYYVFDGSTGNLHSLISARKVGYYNGRYWTIKILGKRYRIHHVGWFLYYGEWPKIQIDHEDQNKLNNKISNLREGSKEIQYTNKPKRSIKLKYKNKSKYGKGIYKRRGRFEVYVVRNNKRHYLGVFKTIELAQKSINEFNNAN